MPDRNRQRGRNQRFIDERDQVNQNSDPSDDWVNQVNWHRARGPYRDYGWEAGESALPEFRDSSVYLTPDERRMSARYGRELYQQNQGPYSGVGPKNYQRSDDRIMEEVNERLTQHGQINARNIHVDVKDGEVTLTGTVDSRRTKRMAEDTVDTVNGVQDVHNQLKIDKNMQGMGRSSRQSNRIDRVGKSGVYPVSGPWPESDAPVQGEASWGQGERGAAGYQDHGESEINMGKENQK